MENEYASRCTCGHSYGAHRQGWYDDGLYPKGAADGLWACVGPDCKCQVFQLAPPNRRDGDGYVIPGKPESPR